MKAVERAGGRTGGGKKGGDAEGRGDASKAAKYRKAIAELADAAKGLKVIEDGDRIILNEGIGQRLSKLGKIGENSTHEQDLAIARKIFETVDRKSAEPQTRPDSQKGVTRARELFADDLTLTPEERKILESPHAILLIHDADGRLRSARLGDASEVSIPPGTAAVAILSHNHPSGRGPSDSDVKSMLANPGLTLRIAAVNENGKIEIFSLKAASLMPNEDMQDLISEYRTVCQALGDTAAAGEIFLSVKLLKSQQAG